LPSISFNPELIKSSSGLYVSAYLNEISNEFMRDSLIKKYHLMPLPNKGMLVRIPVKSFSKE